MNGNWYALRWQVLQRDNFTCVYCGQSAPSVILHIDHKIPRAAGGDDDMANLVTACEACNIGRNLDHFVIPERVNRHKHKVPLFDCMVDYLKVNEEATATEISKALGRQKSRCNIAHLLANSNEFRVSRREGKCVYYTMLNKGERG